VDGHKEVGDGAAYSDMAGGPDHFDTVGRTVVDTATATYTNTVESFRERPTHTGILTAAVFGLFFTIVALMASWYQTSHTNNTVGCPRISARVSRNCRLLPIFLCAFSDDIAEHFAG